MRRPYFMVHPIIGAVYRSDKRCRGVGEAGSRTVRGTIVLWVRMGGKSGRGTIRAIDGVGCDNVRWRSHLSQPRGQVPMHQILPLFVGDTTIGFGMYVRMLLSMYGCLHPHKVVRAAYTRTFCRSISKCCHCSIDVRLPSSVSMQIRLSMYYILSVNRDW